jgi:O-antigen/teichoic acid export membrane protein
VSRTVVLHAAVVLALAHSVQVLASLANAEILTRALGPALYGDYAAVLATYVLLGALTDLGTGLVAVRAMTREPERAPMILVATLRLRFLAGFAGSVIGAARFAHDPAGLVGAALPVIQAWSSSRLLLQATLEKTRVARATVLGRLLQTGLVFLAMRIRPEPVAAVGALALGELTFAALLRREVGFLPRVPWSESFRESRAIAVAALPLAGAFVANELAGSLDVLLLRGLRSSEETGLYALAAQPLQALEPLPRLILWSVFPLLSRRSGEDAAFVARAHRTTVAALGAAAAALAAGTALCGPALLATLFDPRYEQAGGPLVVLAFGTALGFLASPAESTLVALDRTRSVLAASAGALVVNVLGNILLVPRFGTTGAAWAWVATAATQLTLASVLSKIALPVSALARSAAAGLVLYAALRPLKESVHPLALVPLGAVVYGVSLMLLDWSPNEDSAPKGALASFLKRLFPFI